jgi:hypothetical protein
VIDHTNNDVSFNSLDEAEPLLITWWALSSTSNCNLQFLVALAYSFGYCHDDRSVMTSKCWSKTLYYSHVLGMVSRITRNGANCCQDGVSWHKLPDTAMVELDLQLPGLVLGMMGRSLGCVSAWHHLAEWQRAVYVQWLPPARGHLVWDYHCWARGDSLYHFRHIGCIATFESLCSSYVVLIHGHGNSNNTMSFLELLNLMSW